MTVSYDSNKLIPAPFISIRKEYNTADDGAIIGSVWNIQVLGKIIAYKGSPNSTGTFWTISGYPPDEVLTETTSMAAIVRKQEAIRKLFSNANEGKSFEAQPWDGTAPIKCNPRIKGIEFPNDSPQSWFDRCNYVINLEADIIYVNGTALGEDSGDVTSYKVSKATDEWNMEALDEYGRTYRLTHSVSATGKRFYDETGALVQQAWENGKDYVLNKIGLGIKPDRMAAPGVLDITLSAFNYVRSQHVNELSGTFAVTESWLCYNSFNDVSNRWVDHAIASFKAIEEYTLNFRTAEDGITKVSIEGTIKGLETRDNTTYILDTIRYDNALEKWNDVQNDLLDRCNNVGNITLSTVPLNKIVGHNPENGIITYTYEFDNRPTNLVTGAISEVITVINNAKTDVFASIPVLGRPLGPILQSIGTVTTAKRTIQIEAQLPAATNTTTPVEPNTNAIIAANVPNGTVVFLSQDDTSWTSRTGKYSRTVSFTWE